MSREKFHLVNEGKDGIRIGNRWYIKCDKNTKGCKQIDNEFYKQIKGDFILLSLYLKTNLEFIEGFGLVFPPSDVPQLYLYKWKDRKEAKEHAKNWRKEDVTLEKICLH